MLERDVLVWSAVVGAGYPIASDCLRFIVWVNSAPKTAEKRLAKAAANLVSIIAIGVLMFVK